LTTIDAILKSACGSRNFHLEAKPEKRRGKVVKPRNDCPEVQKMHWDLKYWCIENNLTFLKEYKFSKDRKFRFDFGIEEHRIGIEYQGLNSKKSGHTTLVGYTKDTEKINLAISLGWRVLTFTILNYQTVLQKVEDLINPVSH
jgi:hypothetical protein